MKIKESAIVSAMFLIAIAFVFFVNYLLYSLGEPRTVWFFNLIKGLF